MGGSVPPARTRSATPGELAALLAPYADPGLPGRLVDVPPAVAAAVVELLPADLGRVRLNFGQPPMAGLVALAERFGGRLVGSLVPGRLFARIDGVQVPAPVARELTERLAAVWPTTGEEPGAVESAVAEAWPTWTSSSPSWQGVGTDLLSGPPSGVEVVGLWWD